jgi:hypothetical protein
MVAAASVRRVALAVAAILTLFEVASSAANVKTGEIGNPIAEDDLAHLWAQVNFIFLFLLIKLN